MTYLTTALIELVCLAIIATCAGLILHLPACGRAHCAGHTA